MKIFLILLSVFSFLGLISYSVKYNSATNQTPNVLVSELPKETSDKKEKPLVLVELFTSEGCSSCPPADRVLAELEKKQSNPNAEIVALSMHVDYWNSIGWKDRFSSPLFSQRQNIYGEKFKLDSIYTPQMIVDGAKQFVGSNIDEANKAINESAKLPKAKIDLAVSENNLKINISDVPAHNDATFFLAIAEGNLSTKVGGGENGGRTLEHNSVVRDLKPLGKILAADNKIETATVFQLQTDWNKANLKLVVFIQDNQSRKILGANFLKLN